MIFFLATALRILSPEPVETPTPKVFLAGSATIPWRDELLKKLESTAATYLDPVNPTLHETNQPKRIEWEQSQIQNSDYLVVWLPASDLKNPFTFSLTSLFEFGRFIEMSDKPLLIGIDPDYILRKELILQIQRLRPELPIYDSLDALATALTHTLEDKK